MQVDCLESDAHIHDPLLLSEICLTVAESMTGTYFEVNSVVYKSFEEMQCLHLVTKTKCTSVYLFTRMDREP